MPRSSDESFFQLISSHDRNNNVRGGEWHDFVMPLGDRSVALPGKWEVGLKSISYTHGFDQIFDDIKVDILWLARDDHSKDWLNNDSARKIAVDDGVAKLYSPNFKYGFIEHATVETLDEIRQIRLKGGNFKTAADLVAELNEILHYWWSAINQLRIGTRKPWLDSKHEKMSIIPGRPVGYNCIAIPILDPEINAYLGMPAIHSREFVRMVMEYETLQYFQMISPYMIDFKQNKRVLTLNTSLVDSTLPHREDFRVLRILPDVSTREFNEQITHDFQSPTYLPVNTSTLNNIGLSLKYDGIFRVSENMNRMLVAMLHLRQVKKRE